MQDLSDTDAHLRTMQSIERGEQEILTAEEAREALSAPTPLAFWRRKRGHTQKTLSQQIGVSQSYVADLEAGRRKGDPALIKRLAKALKCGWRISSSRRAKTRLLRIDGLPGAWCAIQRQGDGKRHEILTLCTATSRT